MDLHHRRGDLGEERFLLSLFVDPDMNGFAESAYCCYYCERFHRLRVSDISRYKCINIIENSMMLETEHDRPNRAIGGGCCQCTIAQAQSYYTQKL